MGNNQYILPYTKEQREWVRIYFFTHSLKETTIAFNERYNLDKKEGAIRHLVAGVKNRTYTIEMLDFLKDMASVPNNTWKYITQEFNKKFNTNKNWKTLCRFGYLHGINTISNRDDNFTVFPKPRYEIGTERIRVRDGYIVVKVDSKHKDEKANWKLKHYMVWEQHNGKVPKNCVLIFLDGNTLNCDISNLACVDKGTLKKIQGNRYTPNFYGKSKITEAMLETIKTENLLRNIDMKLYSEDKSYKIYQEKKEGQFSIFDFMKEE